MAALLALLCAISIAGCRKEQQAETQPPTETPNASAAPTLTWSVVQTFPHDTSAFTEGLQYVDGVMYEGTGLEGKSVLRKYDLKTGKVLKEAKLASKYFGEGISLLGDKIYQLTYQTEVGFVYDAQKFTPIDSFRFFGEGWGMTTDGSLLLFSDGSSNIRYMDPSTKQVTKTLSVKDKGYPVYKLNELEIVKGDLYANIWETNRIAIIDMSTGLVKAWLDLSVLIPDSGRRTENDVLNGIAYDAKNDRLFVTGKNWGKIFEIKVQTNPPA